MKKFFSAFLLMTAMVLSVGTFVACNDLTEEMETVQTQATSNAAAVKALGDQITALQTALATAQSTADAAKKAGDEAKAAAAQAKADAIAEAKAECEIVKKALETKIAEVEAALAGKASKAELDAAIAEATKGLKALETALGAKIAGIEENLNKLASKEDLSAEVAKLLAADKELALQIAALKAYSDTTYATVADAEALRAELTKLAEENYSELYKLIGGNASAIQAVVDTVDVIAAALQELIGANTSNINELAKSLAGVIETADSNEAAIAALEEALAGVLENNAALAESVAKQIVETNEYLDKEIAELAKADAANQELINTVYNALTLAVEDLDADLKAEIAEVAAGLETLEAKVAGLQAEVAKIAPALATIEALKDRLQSVSYVPEWTDGPKAVLFDENEEYGYVHMSFEVAPKEYAKKINEDNTTLVGLGLTKAVEVEEFEVKILSKNPETGIVEVMGYIPTTSGIWKKAVAEAEASNTTEPKAAALALRVVAEDAQFTSAYTKVDVLGENKKGTSINNHVYFGRKVEGEFVATNSDSKTTWEYLVEYDTLEELPLVELFKELEYVVNVPGFFQNLPVEEAAEKFGFDINVTTLLGQLGADYYSVTNKDAFDLDQDKKVKETPAFIVETADKKESKDSLNVVVYPNEAAVNGVKSPTEFINKSASATLAEGYFRVNGKKAANFHGLTAKYMVTNDVTPITLEVGPVKTIKWSLETYNTLVENDNVIRIKDVDVAGGDGRDLSTKVLKKSYWSYTTEDTDAPAVEVTFISIDNADVYVTITDWPEETATYNYEFTGRYTEDNSNVIITFPLEITLDGSDRKIEIDEVTATPEITPDATTNAKYITLTADKYGEDEEDMDATTVALPDVDQMIYEIFKGFYATEKEQEAALEYIQKTALKNLTVKIYAVNNGEVGAEIPANATYSYSKPTGKPEDSKITIPFNRDNYANLSGKQVLFTFNVEHLGFTVKVSTDVDEVVAFKKWTADTAPQPYTLEALNTYSTDLTTTGVAPFTISQNAVYRYYTVNETTGEKEYAATMPSSTSDYFKEHAFDYWKIKGNTNRLYTFGDQITVGGATVSNAVNLMKYFKLVQKENTTVNLADYTLKVTLDSYIPEEAIANAPKIAFATTGNLDYPMVTPLFNAEYDEEGEYVGNNGFFTINPADLSQLYLDWNGFKSYNATVTVSLIKNYNTSEDAPEGSNELCGYREIALTHNPIVSVPATAEDAIVVYYDDIKTMTDSKQIVELAKGVRVYAADGKSPLYNLAATDWTEVFASYKPTSESTFATEETKSAEYETQTANYFNRTLGLTANFVNELDEDNEPIADEYQYTTTDSDFYAKNVTFDATNGQLTINHDATLNLAGDITITIPVEIGHMFTYTGESSEVKVVIKPGHKPAN